MVTTPWTNDQKKSKKKSSGFPIGPDGRMIIKDLDDGDDDDDEDEEDGEDGGNYNLMDSDSDDENGEKSQNTFEKLVGDGFKILIFSYYEFIMGHFSCVQLSILTLIWYFTSTNSWRQAHPRLLVFLYIQIDF